MKEPKQINTMPKCPLSLRPDARVVIAYVLQMPYAVAIVDAWESRLQVRQVEGAEWEAIQRCEVTFGGAA